MEERGIACEITAATDPAAILKSDQVKESFDDWCDKLPRLFFYPVHKSFLINLHYVDKYSYSEVYLTDGTRIPVAPRKQALFHKFWFQYLRRR